MRTDSPPLFSNCCSRLFHHAARLDTSPPLNTKAVGSSIFCRLVKNVGVDRPLERLDRRAEILADRGERVGDDQVVEDDHEEGDRDVREGPTGAGAGHRSEYSLTS